jgi:NAD(P)-dependent dehydrogenase (short-subunit alcohol dehydrogenase family)
MKKNPGLPLIGKVAVVTGGYGHLGKSMSLGLAEAGATVIVAGKDIAKFKKAFKDTGNITFEKIDISSTASIKAAFKKISKKYGSLDVLVNNACYTKGTSAEKLTDEQWNFGIDGVLGSVFRCIREAIPHMKKRGGNIINISSMYGMVSPDFRIYIDNPDSFNPPHYGAAKAGVIQLTRYYGAYLAKYKIRVNCITPGPFPAQADMNAKGFAAKLSAKNPMNRVGTPDELIGPVVFLASDASSYMTGQNLVVDGGWTIW